VAEPDAVADGDEAADEAFDVAEETLVLLSTVLEAPLLLPQFPKPAWHPVPQYADVEPHQPLALQQLPKELPTQVYPLVPPQVASVVTLFVDVGTGAEDLVEEATLLLLTGLLLVGLLLPQLP
jgi:hypothetical protein